MKLYSRLHRHVSTQGGKTSSSGNAIRAVVSILVLLALASAWPHLSRAYFELPIQFQGQPPPNSASKEEPPKAVPGEILVRFRSGATPTKGQRSALVLKTAQREITVAVERFGGSTIVDGLRVARVAAEDTSAAIDALRARTDVLYAEPNLIRRASRTPNDLLFPQLWGLRNTGQSTTSGGNPGIPGNDIRAHLAWDTNTGSRSIVVGVIDSGIDINHIDLSANIWTNPGEISGNGVDDDGNGYIDDIRGWDFAHNDNTVFDYTDSVYPPVPSYNGDVDDHGTHVAGTIGAVGDNGIGVAGVNWQVSLLSLKFLTGLDGSGTSADALEAYAYARTMRELWASSGGTKGANIRVLNNSYGGTGFSQAELDAIRALGNSGILFVVSAGNESQNNDRFPIYPSSYVSTNLISVAASTGTGARASFSNFGASVRLAAPGNHILSTTPNNSYNFFSGTSMAAPHVSGGAALILAAHPNLTLSRLRGFVLNSGYFASAGRVHDVNATLNNIATNDTTAPGSFALSGQTLNFPQFRLTWTAPGDDGNSGRVAGYEVRIGNTDLTNPANFDLATPLPAPSIIEDPGSPQGHIFQIPWRHTNSVAAMRAVDEAGNAGPISTVPILEPEDRLDPYVMSTSGPGALSTGGTPLNFHADDDYKSVQLPFDTSLFGITGSASALISTNGALYLGGAPDGPTRDAFSSVSWLNGYRMIAAAWDDLRTDRRPGDDVYVVTPNEDTIIFRWQAVTFDSPIGPNTTRGENPVNFEIEVRQNGTIILRYGDGNQKLFPVVGLGGGYPQAYVVDSHTSEAALKDLTNAGTVTFTLLIPPPLPTANLALTMANGPNPVVTGGEETFNIQVFNSGPLGARDTLVTDQLPTGLDFVSCTTNRGTCSGPPVGSNGTVTINVGTLDQFQTATMSIIARVSAPANTTVSNTVSVTNSRFDNNLGNNSATASIQVVPNLPFDEVRAISASLFRSFAVRQDGIVWGWGRNEWGAIGDGSSVGTYDRATQTLSTDAVGVVAGFDHTLALKTDGTVHGWGSNSFGKIRSGSSGSFPSPLIIPDLTNIIAVAAGLDHSLALRNDGVVLAWGGNSVGQLGQGTTDANAHSTPMPVPGLANIVAITANSNHSLALRNDGTVWGWGNNINGQLGPTSGNNFRSSPVQIPGISGVSKIATGFHHVIVVKTDGTVWGWGMNAFGQTGSTDFVNVNPTPTQVPNLTNVISAGAGWGFSIAVRSDGTVWGWGANGVGQLGNGTTGTNPQTIPTQVTGLTSAVQVSVGEAYTLALLNDGTLRSWGDNQYSQLGDGTSFNRLTPVTVVGLMVVTAPRLVGAQVSSAPIDVVVRCDTPGAVIHYTTNGQDPVESDPIIASAGTLTITQTLTLKVRAFKTNWTPSSVVSRTFTILPPSNPIDNAFNFVRQHYLDFLNREPDSGGQGYWTDQITSCGNNVVCIHERRIGVSGAFFVELEFQRTGYVVYRMHRAAFGTEANNPTLAKLTFEQFMADRPLVIDGPGLPQSTINFANAFVQRPAFLTEYPLSQTNAQFVNKVFDTAGLTPYVTERQQQIDAMTNNGKTRAQVLLDVIEIAEFKEREYNRSFVLMQYFGYLRRGVDLGGYNFWLNVLNNQEPNNYRGMICSFITSAEYQQRFGTLVTRTNADCAQ